MIPPVNAAAVRIAVSSSTFRRPLADGSLTQLEWLERCASELGVDGVLADLTDFPRRDAEYVAQLRKVAVDLGLVPFGIDDAALLDPAGSEESRAETLRVAARFGAAVVRSILPAPGTVPPASFVEAVALAKAVSRAAKGANITVIVAAAPGTIGEDLAGVLHLLKDVDSAWLRACPSAFADPPGGKQRFPALLATPADAPRDVAERAYRGWLVLDAPPAPEPWPTIAGAIAALRSADAERSLERPDRSGRLDPG